MAGIPTKAIETSALIAEHKKLVIEYNKLLQAYDFDSIFSKLAKVIKGEHGVFEKTAHLLQGNHSHFAAKTAHLESLKRAPESRKFEEVKKLLSEGIIQAFSTKLFSEEYYNNLLAFREAYSGFIIIPLPRINKEEPQHTLP